MWEVSNKQRLENSKSQIDVFAKIDKRSEETITARTQHWIISIIFNLNFLFILSEKFMINGHTLVVEYTRYTAQTILSAHIAN